MSSFDVEGRFGDLRLPRICHTCRFYLVCAVLGDCRTSSPFCFGEFCGGSPYRSTGQAMLNGLAQPGSFKCGVPGARHSAKGTDAGHGRASFKGEQGWVAYSLTTQSYIIESPSSFRWQTLVSYSYAGSIQQEDSEKDGPTSGTVVQFGHLVVNLDPTGIRDSAWRYGNTGGVARFRNGC